MPAAITLTGRVFALKIPPKYRSILYPHFFPFIIQHTDTPDALFQVECTENRIYHNGAQRRGDILFRENSPDTFSILEQYFEFIVLLEPRTGKLLITSDAPQPAAIIFSSDAGKAPVFGTKVSQSEPASSAIT